MERDKIYIIGELPASYSTALMLAKESSEVVFISPEDAEEKYNIQEAFRPEPIIITNPIIPELSPFQPPLTRAERRKLKRKSK